MGNRKILSMLGLAMKARKLVSGELAVENAVRSGKAKLVIIAQDASENAKKNYRDLTGFYKIPIYECLSKTDLGLAIGKISRVAIAIVDTGFSNSITKAITEETMGE